ncbi:MAG: glycoside hydrolase family 5 protein [Rubrivivax sp.]|nr:MAG: glycoside hydrolase family 5 protein [Rubrivivax sp.]
MGDSAVQVAQKLRIGLNIGNTLEAFGGKSETYWGNPRITREFVQFAKDSGFNAIRLPVSWNQYADAATARIEAAWLARVQEVVQYCIDADLHVVLNVHWDGGWLEENVTPEQQVAVNHRQKAFWQQIATQLRDFDSRLMFAGANEPNVKTAAQMAVLMSYHQTFIDAVRATGGRNALRTLVVQGPSTDVELTHQLMTGWPTDTASGRLMAEIHYYTPWNFTGMTKDETWGNQFYYWGLGNHSATDTAHNPTWGEESTLDTMAGLMKARFVDKGIPVIVGEYAAQDRSDKLTGDALALHRQSRAAYCKAVTQRSRAMGLVPFYWDTGGLLDRSRNQVLDTPILTALMDGAR